MTPVDLLSQLEETKFLRLFRYLANLRDNNLYADNLCLPTVPLDLADAELMVRTVGQVSGLRSWATSWVFQIEHIPSCLWNKNVLDQYFEARLKAVFRTLKKKSDPLQFLHGGFNDDVDRPLQYPLALDLDYYIFTNVCHCIDDDAASRFSDKAHAMFSEVLDIPLERHPRFGIGTPESALNANQAAVEKFILDLLGMPSSYYFLAREGRISIAPSIEHGSFFASQRSSRHEIEDTGLATVITSALSSSSRFAVPGLSDLELLINSPDTKEADLQEFFRTNSHFLFALDERYCDIRPHICLFDSNEDRLMPDFMARIHESNIWNIIELKRPQHFLTNRTSELEKISSFAARGVAELLQYRDFFAVRGNRNRVCDLFKTAPYEPALVLVIGRGRERHPYEWRSSKAGVPGVQVVSYDYLFRRA